MYYNNTLDVNLKFKHLNNGLPWTDNGIVIAVGDGVVKSDGLVGSMYGKKVFFLNVNVYGLICNLNKNTAHIINELRINRDKCSLWSK